MSLNLDADTIAAIAALGTALAGIVAFYRQGKENQQLRRKDLVREILLPLIKEFDKSKELRIAKEILDDIPIYLNRDTDKEIKLGHYDKARLTKTLQHHSQPRFDDEWQKGDHHVRASFSAFFDFLAKLEYLLSIGLISIEQLEYFEYYIDRAAKNQPVRDFAKLYEYPLRGKLHTELKSV